MFKWRVTVVWRGRCRFTKWQPPGRRLRRRRGRERVPLSPTSRPNCPSLTPATISRHFVCLRVCAVQEWVGASLARLWSVCCASNQKHSLSIHRCTCMHACRRARTHTHANTKLRVTSSSCILTVVLPPQQHSESNSGGKLVTRSKSNYWLQCHFCHFNSFTLLLFTRGFGQKIVTYEKKVNCA